MTEPTPVPEIKPRHFPPPPPLAPKAPGLWRRTPPAIFPPLMGLFGLGLAWRTFATTAGLEALAPIGEVILGATLLLYAFSFVAFVSKPLRRPAVLIEDLRILPGRAGSAAFALGMILSAAALVPYTPDLAFWIVCAGMVLLAVVGILAAWVLLTGPAEQRLVSPVFHLTYVGYILAPLTLARLGFVNTSLLILIATMVVASLIYTASLHQLATTTPPAPLRPLLAIHLAPISLFTTVAALIGWNDGAHLMVYAALAMLALIAVLLPWILKAGVSPMWGALTFPLAACATAVMLALPGQGVWIGAVLLLVASALNPWVAVTVFKGWAKGDLAAKTNAATA
ncbi:MAG: tellurium resistance protein [Paracoccaceae bacterium]